MTPDQLKDLIGEPVGFLYEHKMQRIAAREPFAITKQQKRSGKYLEADSVNYTANWHERKLYTTTQLQPLIQRLEEAERLICEIDRCVGLGEGVGIDHYMIGLAADRDFQTVMAILAANTPPITQEGEG